MWLQISWGLVFAESQRSSLISTLTDGFPWADWQRGRGGLSCPGSWPLELLRSGASLSAPPRLYRPSGTSNTAIRMVLCKWSWIEVNSLFHIHIAISYSWKFKPPLYREHSDSCFWLSCFFSGWCLSQFFLICHVINCHPYIPNAGNNDFVLADLVRLASVLLPPGSIVLINQEAICDAALNPRMSKMWQMMITWGESMMITVLLMVPAREQHPSTYDCGREGALISN